MLPRIVLLALSLGAAPNPAVEFQAALAAEHAGDAAAAERLLEQVCREVPRWPLPALELGQLRFQAGDATRARALADSALAEEPENPRACHLLSLADEALSDLPGAEAADARALALRPGYAEAEDHLGRVLWNEHKRGPAIDLYLQIAAERPGDVAALATLAAAEQEDGRLDAAEQALRTLIEMEPEVAAWHRRLARLLTLEGKGRESSAELGRADRLAGEKRQTRQLRPLPPSRR